MSMTNCFTGIRSVAVCGRNIVLIHVPKYVVKLFLKYLFSLRITFRNTQLSEKATTTALNKRNGEGQTQS